jgi:cytoskeletal protein CcmA (bactofilin family)
VNIAVRFGESCEICVGLMSKGALIMRGGSGPTESVEDPPMALFSKEPEKGPRIQPAQTSSLTNPRPATTELPSEQASLSAVLRPKSTSVPEDSAFLGRGTRVNGRVAFDGSAQVNGEVEGEITVTQTLNIGETASIAAQIRASTIVVAGKVRGDIIGSQRIELCPSAMVVGNLSAPKMVIQEGAQFEGHCSMPGAVGEGEKVSVFPKQ